MIVIVPMQTTFTEEKTKISVWSDLCPFSSGLILFFIFW